VGQPVGVEGWWSFEDEFGVHFEGWLWRIWSRVLVESWWHFGRGFMTEIWAFCFDPGRRKKIKFMKRGTWEIGSFPTPLMVKIEELQSGNLVVSESWRLFWEASNILGEILNPNKSSSDRLEQSSQYTVSFKAKYNYPAPTNLCLPHTRS